MLRTMFASAIAASAIVSLPAQNCFDANLGTDLLLTDDSTAQGLSLGFTFNYAGVAYTDICVCSNGYIWFGPTSLAGGDYSPTEAELLSGAPRLCPLWTDFNPSAVGSGHVYFNNTVPGRATITWASVYEFGGTNAVDLQVVLDASSNITITYGSVAPVGGTLGASVIIGASPGGGATSNPVSFATRPVVIAQDNFAEVIPATGTSPIPYSAFQMTFVPTAPGYVAADNGCTITSLPGPARYEVVGQGCPANSGPALYETFTTAAPPDLSGLDLTFLPTSATDYIALPGINPTYFTGFTNQLTLGDDQTTSVALPFGFPYAGGVVNSIYVSSNGFLTLGATDPGSGCCTGVPATMLAGPPRIAGWWSDLYPPGGGGVYADLDPVSGDFVVSFDNVPEYFTNPVQSFQMALSPTGAFTIRWSNVTTTSHTFLAGYGGGGGVPDPGPVDLSAVSGTPVSSTVVVPLTLAAQVGSLPQVGSNFSQVVTNIPPTPNGTFTVHFVSSEIPGFPLDFIGMTACTAYIALPALFSDAHLVLGAPTDTFTIAIPNASTLYGLQFMSQVLSDDLNANPFGFSLTNGGRWTLGL